MAGTTAQVAAVLQPASAKPTTASAEIYSQPSGADIYINNAYKGVTPLSFENVPIDATKTYTIEIRMEGYKPYTSSGSISPGQNVVIDAALTPLAQPTTEIPCLSDDDHCSPLSYGFSIRSPDEKAMRLTRH